MARSTSVSAWRLPKQDSALAPENVWSNRDMDPIEPERRTWTIWTWLMYWAVEDFSLGTWQIAGSILKAGLSWREALPAAVFGSACTAVPMVLNGALGAELHIPFSVAVRSSFGYYFGYFCVISRCILAMFWLGSVTNNGSVAISVMITAIWPSYAEIPNTIPTNLGVSTMGMISYVIMWLIQLPLLLIPTHKLSKIFMAKLCVTPIAAIATMAWCVHRAGGAGPVFHQQAAVTGSSKAWLFLSCASSISGGLSTLACNIPDFSRFSRDSRAQWVSLPLIPMIHLVGMSIGVIGTSATYVIYGELLWNPLDVYFKWIEEGSAGGRAASFFCGFAWALSQMCVNITANSISAANDLTVLFPKFINVKRGSIMAALIGAWVFVPWRIVAAAENLTTFMAGYAIFLAPTAGILAADYWIVKGRKIDVPALYDPHGRYRYNRCGVNWRAFLAFAVALGPTLPGLIQAVAGNTTGSTGSVHILAGVQRLYSFNWLYGFATSVSVYVVSSKVFPEAVTLVDNTILSVEVIESLSNTTAEDNTMDRKKENYLATANSI